MNKYIFLIMILITSCHRDDPKGILLDLLQINDLSIYDYKYKLVRERYSMYPFTIYYKINIDSHHYNYVKRTQIDSNIVPKTKRNRKFECEIIRLENYHEIKELKIPKWMPNRKLDVDYEIYYVYDDKIKNNARVDAIVSFLYHQDNCYIIYNGIHDENHITFTYIGPVEKTDSIKMKEINEYFEKQE